MYRFFLLFMILMGCAGVPTRGTPLHFGPFFRTNWTPALTDTGEEASSQVRPADSIREKVIHLALDIQRSNQSIEGFWASDTEKILKTHLTHVDWRATEGLSTLVDHARKCNSYMPRSSVRPGDIVLFHNQADTNKNGQLDDWFTGAGIVLRTDGSKLVVITRTNHTPRQITVWPNGPMVHTYKGDLANSFIRVPKRSDPVQTEYLSGQLYAGAIDIEIFSKNCDK